jgi:pimeloyl-ACP methyl ester carboxylesterase
LEEIGMRSGANFLLKDVPSGVDFVAQTIVAEDTSTLTRGIFYRPAGKKPKVGVHIMHPRNDQSLNYNVLPLVKAGYAVLGRGGRWPNSDIATTHEHLLLDVAAGVRRLHELGCERVILLGNSGGAALAAFYQSQASIDPPGRLTHTPAADPIDLNKFSMPKADGILLVGGHPGEGFSMNRWLDPSMIDEADPLIVDPELDMYNPDNGFRIPPEPSHYTPSFLQKFRAAQIIRVQKLDAIAFFRAAQRKEAAQRAKQLEGQDAALVQYFERRAQNPNHLRVIRAIAYPAFVDPSIEPDEQRDVCSYNNDPRPDLANFRTFHSAYLTPEAYLSTWSGISGRAKAIDRLRETTCSLMVVHYQRDGVCHIRDARAMFDASASQNKQFVLIPGADHYGYKILGPHQRGERTSDGTDAAVAWMEKNFPL